MSDETDAAASAESAPAQDHMDPRIGAVVNGKYRVVRVLGRGGMGSVYEARHTTIDRRFAIKFLLEEFAFNSAILKRFEKEAIAAGHLEHPNLAAVIDFGRADNGAPYLVMEYLQGSDCAHLLHQNGPLPHTRACNLIYQACLGLAVAHRADIVHRDLKPENLFVTDAGDGRDLVKVLDFGIAKLRLPDASVATGTGTVMGTFYYMSPEQVRDSGEVDLRTDIWALGVVLYELLSGQKPFDGTQAPHIFYKIFNEEPTPLSQLRPELPRALVTVVERALKKSPDERYRNATELAQALAAFTSRPSAGPATATAFAETELAPAITPPLRLANTSQIGVRTLSSVRPEQAVPAKSVSIKRWGAAAAVGFVLIAAALTLRLVVGRDPAPAAPAVATAAALPLAVVPSPTPSPATADGAVPAPLQPSAVPSAEVRTKFEQRVSTSNKPTPAKAAPTAPAPIPQETPKPTPAPPAKAGLSIDKTNPF